MAAYLTGIFGFAIVIGIWYLLQALARRRSGCALDQDMLEGHGCGACDRSGACRRKLNSVQGQDHGTV